MELQKNVFAGRRLLWFIGTLLLAFGFLFLMTYGLRAEQEAITDLSQSQKLVDQETAEPAETLAYTIVLTNNAISGLMPVTMTDVLPAGLIYQDSVFHPPINGIADPDNSGYDNGVLTWVGMLGSGGSVQIDLLAQVDPAFPLGESITNTAVVLGMDEAYSLTAVTLITHTPSSANFVYLPVIQQPIPVPILAATTPTANNSWVVSWSNLGSDITGYELQEAQTPDFANPNTYNLAGNTTSQAIQHPPAVDNHYYYRVRGLVNDLAGPWSNVVMVTGAGLETTLAASRPNSNNQWTVSWQPLPGVTGYELQEAKNSDFTNPTVYALGAGATSQNVQQPLSWSNSYYYRIRGMVGSSTGVWSDTLTVVGGYRDDFTDSASGWALRRTSYLQKTFSYYGSGAEAGNYIVIVDDRWDWMAASPMRPAPQIPYVIEYRARVHDPSNLVSGGMVFAGDWNGAACPDYNNIYEFTNCFNSFYTLNFIFYGPLKLLYEQVDQLVWCPTCGGSLLKRIGPTIDAGDVLANGPSKEWHTYRLEVRQDGARLFIDGNLRFHFTDTSHFHQPYFGVFASTEEYKPSIWFYDYVQVTPLD
jgi:uncharacterized repeat protein (TIGR01451 family)